jgi:hypothetical protein
LWTSSACCQEFKAILSSDDFLPGKEITLTIQGGTPPFSLFFGSGFFREEKLLFKVSSPDERTFRLAVLENLDPALAKFRTVTVEDKTSRASLAKVTPQQAPSQPKDEPEVAKLTAELQSANEAVRMQAAKKLGAKGPAARSALSALRQLLNDPDEDVRLVAAGAIRRIEGAWGSEWVKIVLPEHRFEIQFPAPPEDYAKRRTDEKWKVEVQEHGWELIRQDPEQVLGFVVFNVRVLL